VHPIEIDVVSREGAVLDPPLWTRVKDFLQTYKIIVAIFLDVENEVLDVHKNIHAIVMFIFLK